MSRLLALVLFLVPFLVDGAEATGIASTNTPTAPFPPTLESYADAQITGLGNILRHRVQIQPFNLVATVIFAMAIVHTFLATRFQRIAHHLEEAHKQKWWQAVQEAEKAGRPAPRETVSVAGRLMHFLGEVEAVFGLWVVPLLFLMLIRLGPKTVIDYVEDKVHFTEPIFVVVIMTLAATRPVLVLAERFMRSVAKLGGGTPTAWWFSILTLGPLLGSFVTEPAAMTISALLLGRQFYQLTPSRRLAYATLGLLFVNVSVGGTLTHFAAPPVLMVAGRWNWDTLHMLRHFGLQAVTGVVLSNLVVYMALRREFVGLADAWESEALKKAQSEQDAHPIPAWITGVHLLAMAWAVLNAHHPVLLVGGLLFFVAFHLATEDFQSRLELRGPILVGFFLAGLVIHGGLQQWWIAPTLGGLGEWPLFSMATLLTAFNDNAAITYLASLVPGFTDSMKHAVVAGAVTGGGLTVIANAPNPAGQSILAKYFPEGISPLGLALGALGPTLLVGASIMLLD